MSTSIPMPCPCTTYMPDEVLEDLRARLTGNVLSS
jgi:hypothetical protein